MKIKTICGLLAAVILLMSAGAATAAEFVLKDTEKNVTPGNWSTGSEALKLKAGTPFTITNTVLHGGKQEGSEVITIAAGDFVIKFSPTRGMGILSTTGKGLRLGWDSPVDEVVNPAFVNLESRGGLGWLEGFNEMMVRCGFEWSGHPVEADGMRYTLHGKAGNTPASKVIVSVDEKAPYTVRVKGLIKENAFKKSNMETWAELVYVPGETSFTIHDVLTNKSDYTRGYQIIYHSNFGAPILEEGAKFVAPVKEVSPFNEYAIAGMEAWDTYLGPTKDFDEMVLNVIPYADINNKTIAMLRNKAGDAGVAITYDVTQLPVLSLWKNTDTLKQGYLTGLEPGTCFAYPVTIAREQGRVRQLDPGKSAEFTLVYSLISGKDAVKTFQDRIDVIQKAGGTPALLNPPLKSK